MNKREQRLLQLTLLSYLKFMGIVIIVSVGLFLVAPSLINLVFYGRWINLNAELASLLSVLFISVFIRLATDFDGAFQLKIQTGFARPQIFKNDFKLILLLSIGLTLLMELLSPNFAQSNYNGYFGTGVINFGLLLLIAYLLNLLSLLIAELLGAFFSLFSKKIRKWMVALSFVILIAILIGIVMLTTLGVERLITAHLIDSQQISDFARQVAVLLFGFRTHGAFNPINLIGTLLLVNGGVTWLLHFLILRLPLQRA